jgi:hypothetical protein
LQQWADRFEILKLLTIKFSLMVPVIDESCDDLDKQLYIVPSLLPERVSDTLKASLSSSTAQNSFFILFSTFESFKDDNEILTVSEMKGIGFLPKGLFSRLLAKLISWCQLTSG